MLLYMQKLLSVIIDYANQHMYIINIMIEMFFNIELIIFVINKYLKDILFGS